jgi:hypothetical protein
LCRLWLHGRESSRPGGDLPHCIASLSARTQTKPTTYKGWSQRELLARIQIVVVDRCTRGAPRKECPAAPADLSTGNATRCRQGDFSACASRANGEDLTVDVERDRSPMAASRDADLVITALRGAIVDSLGGASGRGGRCVILAPTGAYADRQPTVNIDS